MKNENQPVPKMLYMDRGCCRVEGPTAVDSGMVVRLDIFHWIHRFDATIHTDSNSMYDAFKSALAEAVLAYNREELELLIKAVGARDPATLKSPSQMRMWSAITFPGSSSNTTCGRSHSGLRRHSASSTRPLRS